MFSNTATVVCKSLRSLGLSSSKEHAIENSLLKQLRSSGPEYVVSRMKELNDWKIKQLEGNYSFHPSWFKYRKSGGKTRPTDVIGSQIWSQPDETFFAITGAIMNAVELTTPSKKQLQKWKEGVRCNNESNPRVKLSPLSVNSLKSMERILVKAWSNKPWFDLSDITGTSIPGNGSTYSVKFSDGNYPTEKSLVEAYQFSERTCPNMVFFFLRQIGYSDLLGSFASKQYAYDKQDQMREVIKQEMEDIIESRLDGYDEDMVNYGPLWCDDEFFLEHKSEFLFTPRLFGEQPVGQIGFLQQKAGKLRTVANPNRMLQWALRPLGEVIQQYNNKCIPDQYVMNQEKGLSWAQHKLAEGISLTSTDLSSATDTLDYQKFLKDYFRFSPELSKHCPMLYENLSLFVEASTGIWTIPGYVADLIGTPLPAVQWTVGQPLGLRPSFPLLTLMNSACAAAAVKKVDGSYTSGHFACVGDDLIIESRYASAYAEFIQAYNGRLNLEKCMTSNKSAEFCSQIITPSKTYPKKPKVLLSVEGNFNNLEKFTLKGLSPKVPHWVKNIYTQLSPWYLKGYRNIRHSKSSCPFSLTKRLGLHVLLNATSRIPQDQERITLNTLYYRALEQGKQDAVRVRESASSSADISHSTPDVNKHQAVVTISPVREFGSLTVEKTTSVVSAPKSKYDYKSDSQKPVSSEIPSLKKMVRRIGQLSVEERDNLTVISDPITEMYGIPQQSSVLVERSNGTITISEVQSAQLPDGKWVTVFIDHTSEIPDDIAEALLRQLNFEHSHGYQPGSLLSVLGPVKNQYCFTEEAFITQLQKRDYSLGLNVSSLLDTELYEAVESVPLDGYTSER